MKKISQLIMMYKEDADAFGDHEMSPIEEILSKLEESLLSLNESEVVIQKINELKDSSNDEEKEIINDFLQYYKYYGN
jgi:hypothetical protein